MKNLFNYFLSLSLIAGANAETFYLKDGRKLVGEATPKGNGKIEIYINNNGAIDRPVIALSDIRKRTKEDIEDKLFAEIETILPAPDLKTADWYELTIKDYIDEFQTEFPDSPRVFDVKKIGNTLKDELKVIKEGGVKLDGKLIGSDERTSRAYDLDSQIAASLFAEQVEKKKYGAAIEIAQKMELDFPRSKAYGVVLNALPEMCENYSKKLGFQLEENKNIMAQDMKVKEMWTVDEPTKLKAYMQDREEEKTRSMKKIMALKEEGVTWHEVDLYSEESITDMQAKLAEYQAGIEEKLSKYIDLDAGGRYTKAWKHVDKKEFELAKPHIDKLESLGLNIGYLIKLQEYYFEEKDKADEIKRLNDRDQELDLYEQYENLDFKLVEALHEVSEYMNSAKDTETATTARNWMFISTSRLTRWLKQRDELEDLEERDMEEQNAAFAIELKPAVEKFNKAYSRLRAEKELLGTVNEALESLRKVVPNPDTFLTENAKMQIAKAAMRALEVNIKAGLDVSATMVKNESFVQTPINGTPEYYIVYCASSKPEGGKDSLGATIQYYNDEIASNANFELVMANMDESADQALVWGISEKIPFPLVLKNDHERSYMGRYVEPTLPHYVLIDNKGFEITSGFDSVKLKVKELIEQAVEPAKMKK